MAFVTASEILVREKGFSIISNRRSVPAFNATVSGSQPETTIIGAALPLERTRSPISQPVPSSKSKSTNEVKKIFIDRLDGVGDRLGDLHLKLFVGKHPVKDLTDFYVVVDHQDFSMVVHLH